MHAFTMPARVVEGFEGHLAVAGGGGLERQAGGRAVEVGGVEKGVGNAGMAESGSGERDVGGVGAETRHGIGGSPRWRPH